MTTSSGQGTEGALRALATDLVNELAAGRAIELAGSEGIFLELAAASQGPLPSQAAWKHKGDSIWGGPQWGDIHKDAAVQFQQHVDAAHAHLSPDQGEPQLAKGYEQLAHAHRVAAEQILPRAETDPQKESVREGIQHVSDRMRQIDKAAGVKGTHTSRVTAAVPERAARAREQLPADITQPGVQAAPPPMPPPPKGAQAVHPGLGGHLARMPGGTVSGHDMAHVPQPLPQEPASPEAAALDQANKRLDGYAKREEFQRKQDLGDHLAQLREAEAARKGQAKPGEHKPLTDDEYAVHGHQVEDKVEQALRAGKATSQQHSLDGQGRVWSPGRAALHSEILSDYLDRQVDVPSRHEAVILSGQPRDTDYLKQYAVISPDDFKKELAQRGAIPEVEGLSPMESSPLAHEEAAHLVNQAAAALEARGKNLAWEVGMQDHDATAARVAHLKAQGYHVHLMLSDSPAEQVATEAQRRHRTGLEGYRSGKAPLGAKHVPRSSVLRGEGRARGTFESLKPHADSWEDGNDRSGQPQGTGIPSVEDLRRELGRGK